MSRALVIAAVGLGAGCLGLKDIPEDTCGNFVVEGTEDCDAPNDLACATCTWTCTSPEVAPDAPDDAMCRAGWEYQPGGLCCPAGYTCGSDSVCRSPNGRFHATALDMPFPVDTVSLAQVDPTSTSLEIVGLSDSALRVVTAGASGEVIRTQELAVDSAVTTWATGNIDSIANPDDLGVELITTNMDGLIAFNAATGDLATYPFITFVIRDPAVVPGALARVTLAPGGQPAPIIVASRNDPGACGDGMPCAMVLTDGPGGVQRAALPCGSAALQPEDVVGDSIALRPVGPATSLIAFGFRAAQPVDDVVCTYRPVMIDVIPPEPDYLDLGPPTPITLPVGYRVSRGNLVLARVGTQLCPTLLAPIEDVGSGVPAIGRAGPVDPDGPICAIQPTMTVLAGSTGVVPLLAGQLDGGGGEELATSGGVGTLGPAAYIAWPDGATPRTWHSAAIGDINRDGLADVIGASPNDEDLELDGEDVDVLRQRPAALGGGFAASRIFTARPVTFVRSADVDGDLYDDILFVEAGDLTVDTTLEVAFGAPAGGPPLVEVAASLEGISDVLVGDLGGPAADGRADVILGSTGGGSVLYGSWTRQLIATLLLDGGPINADPIIGGIATGDINGDRLPDLIALDRGLGMDLPSLILCPQDELGVFLPTARVPRNELDGLKAGGGAIHAVRLPGMDHDVVVAIAPGDDGRPAELIPFDIIEDVIARTLDVVPLAAAVPVAAVSRLEGSRIVDVDHDADPDLLLDFGRLDISEQPTTWWIELSRSDAVPLAVTATRLQGVIQADCQTSAPIDLDPALPGRELLIGCTSLLERVGADPANPTFFDLPADFLRVDQLAAGDVNGDGIDDLIVLDDRGAGRLSIYLQCTTRDPGPCAGGGPVGGDR